MTRTHKILLTGNEGYIGSVMTGILLEAGHEVVGLDAGYYAAQQLVPAGREIPTIRKDLRDVTAQDVAGFTAVIHLGALSNDPVGNLDDRWTDEINRDASIRLAELAKVAGVRRFLFSSSCIMYGVSQVADVDETSPLAPRTAYARSKVDAERAIAPMTGDGFAPVFLRNGTLYGLSSRMRFDTVLNNLVGAAVVRGAVTLHGDGSPWRPVIHVEDVARAFLRVLEADEEIVAGQAFNVGADHLNYRILDLAQAVCAAVPGARLEVLARPDADERTYRASFAKFARTFPDFRFRWTAAEGAADLYRTLHRIGLTAEQFEGWPHVRLKTLTRLIETGALDGSLRWARPLSA